MINILKDNMKKINNMDKLLIIDHINKVIIQERELNPPTWNCHFRSRVKEKYPDYELK